jgi:ABC-type uncharacterized transport system involved in gliding motility auxiliary subunit
MEGLKQMNPEEKKGFFHFFSKQSTKYGINTLLTILIVLGILIFIEAISYRHHKRFDLTTDSRYTLSQQSRQILSSLQKDIKAIAFYKEGQLEKEPIKNLLEQYAYSSKHFTFEFIDPDRKPELAEKYKIADYETIVLECNGREERIYKGDEQRITNGILKVIRNEKKTVYFTKGHGEHEILDFSKRGYSAARIAMEDENYIIKDILLLREKIPADASVVIISGPQKDFFESEIKEIASYLEKGGKVIFMIDPYTSPRISEFLKQYDILLGDDMIIDTLSRLFGADYLTPVVTNYEYHPITKDFNLATFFTTVRSVRVSEKKKEGVSAQVLASTGPGSWAETDRKSIEEGKPEFDKAKDRKGPVPIAAVATINEKKDGKSRSGSLVVFGDSDFADNTLINLSGNKDLFLNTIGWLAGENALISIRKKPKNASPVVLTRKQGQIVFWSSVVILPLIILFLGIIVFRRRRRNQ